MKIKILFCLLIGLFLFNGCKKDNPDDNVKTNYLDFSKRDDQFTGGIKMIPIKTSKGTFNVWTKRIGNNPKIKVLLLHGGPGLTHELYECFEGYFPNEGIEFIYYDQLGSYYSDQPKDKSLWTNERFVEEVEQVRIALNLNKNNFYILGQSWGGILAMDYALKYQQNLKGLIISNMMASIPEYNKYAQEVLGPQMDKNIYNEIMQLEKNNDFNNPRYTELLFEHYYTQHILRMPQKDWPESIKRCFKHINSQVYITMQGYSEFGISGDAYIKNWDVTKRLKELAIPTLTIGSKYDTMDSKHMEWIAKEVQNGRFLFCSKGSHLSQYDDQKTYFTGLIKFLKDVDSRNFKQG
jgi:proline iminopeptidase